MVWQPWEELAAEATAKAATMTEAAAMARMPFAPSLMSQARARYTA